MAGFKTYLSELVLKEGSSELNADLIYQKVIDALDNAHIDFDEDRICFHIGRLAKNTAIDLVMVIRPSDEDEVRLGRDSEGQYTIVVDVSDDLPSRDDIDDFIANDRMRAMHVKQAICRYLDSYHKKQDAPLDKTKYEDEAMNNAHENFEMKYESLVRQLKEKMTEYKGVSEELSREMETEDMGKREAAKMAMVGLAKEYFGENADEFKKIVSGMMKNDYLKGLTKENKDKLFNRLDSYYEQKVRPYI